jgi:hypothetical protein
MHKPERSFLPWLLTGLVSFLAIYRWGSSFAWQFSSISTYQLFPVFGLLAFSIMWSHYLVGSLKHDVLQSVSLESYFRFTGYAVLVAIILHPGLLIYRLFRDGYGLPPGSYEHFVAPGLAWVTLLGTVSLLCFLAFELHRWYGRRSWWRYVIAAGDAAMVAIFYHGLRLGSQLMGGWYRVIWFMYGLSLVIILGRKYLRLLRHQPGVEQTTDW